MDDTLSGKRYLFAWAITDGFLDNCDWSEERKVEMILSLTRIKEKMLNELPDSDPKYQNNEGGQNNGKVSK